MDYESLAISAVMDCISRTDFLVPSLNRGDKEPSWDGNIYIYKDRTKNKNGLGRIPVQVKGKSDLYGMKLDRNTISFPINICDLLNYYNDGGLIFFVVEILQSGDSIIYYAQLLPWDIYEYLRNANDQKSISVKFKLFPTDDPQQIEDIVIRAYELRTGHYELNWSGKRMMAIFANKPIEATLHPCPEESVNFDTTENLYIEGERLDVLKLLCNDYRGQIKMVYFDPPYNTGFDIIYENDYSQTRKECKSIFKDNDNQCNHLAQSIIWSASHSKWLNMMYPYLYVVEQLLSEDGVIFISIDDNEVQNLRHICDEIFGASNFVQTIVYERMLGNSTESLLCNHEYILIYAKNLNKFNIGVLPISDEVKKDIIILIMILKVLGVHFP